MLPSRIDNLPNTALEAMAIGQVVVGTRGDAATGALLGAALRPFLPSRLVTGGDAGGAPEIRIPLLEGKTPVEGRPAAYVCRDRVCGLPIPDADALARELGGAA